MEAVMKSIVPAVMVVVLQAGFLFSVAVLPSPVVPLRATVEVASRQPAATGAAKVSAPAAVRPASAGAAVRPGARS
jgi:hypothetical protein